MSDEFKYPPLRRTDVSTEGDELCTFSAAYAAMDMLRERIIGLEAQLASRQEPHPAPVQQPLGIEEIQKLAADNATGWFLGPLTFARAIEAKHGIKGKP